MRDQVRLRPGRFARPSSHPLGEYATAINIFNGDDETVEYTKRLAFTTPCGPEGEPEIEGETTDPIEGDLRSLVLSTSIVARSS